MPEIPNITPEIKLKREEVINLLLASIAMEELGLAHIINAEGEKLQKAIHHAKCFNDLLASNKSVERMLKTITKKEMLLQFKLEEVLEIPDHHYHKPHKPPKNHHPKPPKQHHDHHHKKTKSNCDHDHDTESSSSEDDHSKDCN